MSGLISVEITDVSNIPQLIRSMERTMYKAVGDVASVVEFDARDDLKSGAATAGAKQLSEFTKAERRAQGLTGNQLYRSGEMAENLNHSIEATSDEISVEFKLPDSGAVYGSLNVPRTRGGRDMGRGPMGVGPISYRGFVSEHGFKQRMTWRQFKWFWAQKRRLEKAGFLDPVAWAYNRRNSSPLTITHPERRWLSRSIGKNMNEYVDVFILALKEIIRQLLI